jgi:peptidoglycan/xylan/chitin deacetylase (PgdA/CDA1 family)
MGLLGRIIAGTVYRSGAAAAVRHIVAKRRVSVLMYHDPSPDTMAAHLKYLRPRYHGVSLSRVVDAMAQNTWNDLPDFPLVLTFDDGWKGNVEAVDLCRRYGFPVTIYVCSEIVGTRRHYSWTTTSDPESLKPLPTAQRLAILRRLGFAPGYEHNDRQAITRAEIHSMLDIVEFGSHTRFHPILTACTTEEAWDEIHTSRTELEALANRPCRHFAYPNGDYTRREVEMVKRAGYSSARTLDVGWNTPSTDPYQFRFLGTADDASVARLAADLSGAGFLWTFRETGRLNGVHKTIILSEPMQGSPGGVPVIEL